MERSYDVKKLIPIRRGPVRRRLGMAWYSARRYLLWCSGKYRFAKSRERRDVLTCVAAGHATPLLRKLPPGTILTPHPKELERILGDCQNAYARLQMARELAQATHVLIVLKGAYTATIFPDRSVHFNTTGNPGMATAGSGDVLTGVLLSLLAQGYAPREAALLGVYLHGLAGDLAAREVGMRGMTASDLVRFLPRAWEELEA